LFDFDKSGVIERKELEMILQTGIRALCKLVNIKLPLYSELEEFAKSLFSMIDTDNSKTITNVEFKQFMQVNREL
jgi:Ca2+-binding EF-hand superfamily protein